MGPGSETKTTLPCCQETFLLKRKILSKNVIVAAKKVITRKWLQMEPSMLEEWLKTVEEMQKIERLTLKTEASVGPLFNKMEQLDKLK